MKGTILAAVSALLLAPLAAHAATPEPPAPACNWCGLYFGGTLGSAWATYQLTHSPMSANPGLAFPVDATALTAASSPTLHGSGLEAGVHAGYNWQFGGVAAGIEADWELLGVDKTASGVFPFPSTPG